MVPQAKSPVIFLLSLFLLSVSCSKGKTSLDTVAVDAKAIPMMHAENVSSLISDSGITRYRLNAKIWDVYSNDNNEEESYWYFPQGLYVERFDSVFDVEGSIQADTAYNYYKKNLWRLVRNVRVQNLQGEKFETSELYWDEKQKKIYSDKFIRIERKHKVFTGVGFQSNQDLTNYRIFDLQADIDVDEQSPAGQSQNDSLPVVN